MPLYFSIGFSLYKVVESRSSGSLHLILGRLSNCQCPLYKLEIQWHTANDFWIKGSPELPCRFKRLTQLVEDHCHRRTAIRTKSQISLPFAPSKLDPSLMEGRELYNCWGFAWQGLTRRCGNRLLNGRSGDVPK